jgi:hypothetical protein
MVDMVFLSAFFIGLAIWNYFQWKAFSNQNENKA